MQHESRMIKYLLDEHIPSAYRAQLLRHEPELAVWMIGDAGAPAKGTPDPDILRWCGQNDFALVTNNRKSMPRHLADHLAEGGHVQGIFTIDLNKPMGVALEELILIAVASYEGEFADRIVYVPLS